MENLQYQNRRHVGLSVTYRYKRTSHFFIWNYIGNWYDFLNISIVIADINTVQTTL